tara:strand:+ start:682 stop:846 length:165 start_codon:yes stop_codon:yes gene_type:complete
MKPIRGRINEIENNSKIETQKIKKRILGYSFLFEEDKILKISLIIILFNYTKFK